jgi:hypothetical protein
MRGEIGQSPMVAACGFGATATPEGRHTKAAGISYNWSRPPVGRHWKRLVAFFSVVR